jgi:hypothetical protein
VQEIIISKALLTRIGHAVIEEIRENTDKGIDQDGKPFDKYSSNPLYIPASAIFAPGWNTAGKKLIKQKKAEYRSKKGGWRWVIIPGGYAVLRNIRFPQDRGKVNLHLTGNMMNSLAIVLQGNNWVKIGFSNTEAAAKAMYHQVMGAGKRKVKRKFLGLPQDILNGIVSNYTGQIKDEIETKFFDELG